MMKIDNIQLEMAIYVACILLGAILLTRLVRSVMNRFIKAKSRVTMVADPTRLIFLKNAISLIIWLFAIACFVYVIPTLRSFAFTLFAGAGIFMAILGFAAQQAFSNIVAGVFIVVFKPFRVGDLVKVGELDYGIVEDITIRHTVINNFENKRIIIPNSVISSATIVNDTIQDVKICRFVEIGVSYNEDIDQVMAVIKKVCESHPSCADVRTAQQKEDGEPIVLVRLVSFGDFSMNFRAYVWTRDPLHVGQLHSDINVELKKQFDIHGIEIPFPTHTIKMPPKPAPSN